MPFDELQRHLLERGFEVHGRARGRSGACHLIASKRGEWDHGDKECRNFVAAQLEVSDAEWISYRFSVTRSALASRRVQELMGDTERFLLQAGLLRLQHLLLSDDTPGREEEFMLNSQSDRAEFQAQDPAALRAEVAKVKKDVLDHLWQNRYCGIKRTSKQALEDATCTLPSILDSVLNTLEERGQIKGAYGASGIKITPSGEVELENLTPGKFGDTEQHVSTVSGDRATKPVPPRKKTAEVIDETQMANPRAFLSYSWDDEVHKLWVEELATELRNDGVETILDKWHAVPGDQLPTFMEREIRENDYVLIVCTPNYREKSDSRKGGVGYEGDIMTAEVHTQGNHRKFIPILARGTWKESAPSWLKGKYFIDLRSDEASRKNYPDLTATLLGRRAQPPPVRPPTFGEVPAKMPVESQTNDPIKIIGVIVDEVTEPPLDGAPGSALYTVPFQLNRAPSQIWETIFLKTWNSPPQYTTMHRPGIASISGAKVILEGTTIEEVKSTHRDTLILCVEKANEEEARILDDARASQDRQGQAYEEHRKAIQNGAKDISFD